MTAGAQFHAAKQIIHQALAAEGGINWEVQKRKIQPGKYLHGRLGGMITNLKVGGKPQTCIKQPESPTDSRGNT